MRLWVYFVAVSLALPILQGGTLILDLAGAIDALEVRLFMLYEGSIWLTVVAIYLMEGYRARVLGQLTAAGAVVRMVAAGGLTPAATLLISPVSLADIGVLGSVALISGGLALGTVAGFIYWLLTR